MTKRKIILLLLLLLAIWIVIDLCYPFKTDITRIDPVVTAKTEAAMWRSYYEKKPVQLFLQSASLMRSQFHVPFWRSFLVSYYAAKAAFVFKDGKSRQDYEKALPYLQKYFSCISNLSTKAFNADSAAAPELEWWILRRYRDQHPPQEWEQYIAKSAAVVYNSDPKKFNDYAHLRVKAMLLRDKKQDKISEDD